MRTARVRAEASALSSPVFISSRASIDSRAFGQDDLRKPAHRHVGAKRRVPDFLVKRRRQVQVDREALSARGGPPNFSDDRFHQSQSIGQLIV